MDAKLFFTEATKEANSCTMRISKSQLDNPTPCSEWDLRALLQHMVYELSWVPDLLAGKTVAEVGGVYEGDLLGDDAVGAWRKVLRTAEEAVHSADMRSTVHLSYGDFPAVHYVREVGGDILIHGWDVGQAIGCSLRFDPRLAEALYDFVLPRANEFAASGLFGKHLAVPDNASTQTKLLAFFGRKNR